MKIDVIHELEGFGITHELRDGFASVVCPFHADTNPSGSVSLEHGGFKCFSCGATSDFIKFLAAVFKKSPSLIRGELESRYGATNDKIISIGVVEDAHKALADESYLRAQLHKRCVTDELIKQRRLGALNGRVTIPVYNKAGYVVNIRKHRPGGEQSSKVINQRGHGKPPRLYPIDQLKYDKIALCGGELKAIAASGVLNQVGIGAVCITTGEGNWHVNLSAEFRDKTVYIVYDVDEAGVRGAEKVAYQLYPVAREVIIVELPLDLDSYPTGDVNDFLADNGDLPLLLSSSDTPWTPPHKRYTLNGTTKSVHVSQVVNAEYTGKRLKTDCIVAAIAQQPYSVPSKVIVDCPKDQEYCAACTVRFDQEGKSYELHPEDPCLLMMIEASTKTQAEALKQSIGIPSRCAVCDFTPEDYYHIEDARISPKLEITNREVQREMIPAYIMQTGLVLNETYEIAGRMHPHPQTQASTLLVSDSKVSEDALTLYENINPHELNIFKPREWTVESIEAKFDELYEDLEANVTGIYGRRRMHLAIDLAFHSVLFFDAFSKPNQTSRRKGWAEILILGDSAQGKTEATTSLMKHYRLGEKIDCKNATVAGVLGGLQQMGKKWFVAWGVIPNHDKRLVVLEELKGMAPEVFAKLTDMRSSGEAQIPKIEKRKTHARTRLIALSNPPKGRTMETYSQGVTAIRDLIPNPEDVRRFDYAVVVSSNEVSQDYIHNKMRERRNVEHHYTTDLCQRLVLWAWTTDKVVFEDEQHILQRAIELQEQFSDRIPLINAGSTHEKIARLASALAARTYSTDDYETLIVRNCHVDFIVKMLQDTYCAKNFRYDDFSVSSARTSTLEDPEAVKKTLHKLPNLLAIYHHLQDGTSFDTIDVTNWTGFDPELSRAFIGELVRHNAIRRAGARGGGSNKYYTEPGLISLLEKMYDDRELDSRPDYVKEDEGEF